MQQTTKQPAVLLVHDYYQVPGGEDVVVANEKHLLETHGHAAALYARHGLPTVFRLPPLAPPEADEELAGAGYRHFDPSLVLLAPSAYRALRHLRKPADSAAL